MAGVLRFWRTVRHLRVEQVLGRVWFRLARPRPDLSPSPGQRARSRWVMPARRRPGMVGAGTFRFLNEEAELSEAGWDNPARSKLWRYNQHYFDDLNALGAEGRLEWHRALISDWLDANPPGRGTGWEPYPASLRIVNWIKWVLAGNDPDTDMLQSLAVQARWLTRRLEWHLLGNHLFSNGMALVFAGLFFEGREAGSWLETGLRILSGEVQEQVLADGGQFERSPMYHALALEDVLDLVNIARCYAPSLREALAPHLPAWETQVPSMLHWLSAMCHPDGEISFFNDAAIGIAPSPAELAAYAGRLGFEVGGAGAGLTWLRESGYARLEAGPAVLLCDMAPVGPDYLPGHAHADTLSFELSLFGRRVIVNSGTSEYGLGPERLRQRGTPAHSTVTVAGRDSSEVWSGFRVGARARPFDVTVADDGGQLTVGAAHDGYRSLPGRPVHRRLWTLTAHELTICDVLDGGVAGAEARFHFHPDIQVRLTTEGGRLLFPDGREARFSSGGGAAWLEPGTWHPEFGTAIGNFCLVIPLRDGAARLVVSWD